LARDTTPVFQLPAQALGRSLARFIELTGWEIGYPAALVAGKEAAAISGRLAPAEALRRLLDGTGLAAHELGPGNYTLVPVASTRAVPPAGTDTDETVVVLGTRPSIAVGPRRGLQLAPEQIAANVQTATGAEIRESRATSLTDFMHQRMQSVMVNDYQGNPYQADVQFRGFTASPQIGTPQGLSVFFDGVRVNEPFGDVVNWDLIPLNAIQTFDVHPGSNPLFGLNTLGGALAIRTRDGFQDEGIDASVTSGAWGRLQSQVAGGTHLGPLGIYVAVTDFQEDGWRDNSPSDLQQGFAKLSLRTARLEFDGTVLAARNELIGNGLLPAELHATSPESVFTSPDRTRNELSQFNFEAQLNLSDRINVTGQVYRRNSERRASGGDIYEEFDEFSSRVDGPQLATRIEDVLPGFETCKFQDVNQDGVPDYFLDALSVDFDGDGVLEPDDFYDPNDDGELNPTGLTSLEITSGGTRGRLRFLPALNQFNCDVVQYRPARNDDGSVQTRDGVSSTGEGARGLIEGTPIGVITDTGIEQRAEGASTQVNFNLDTHKLMVGASIDQYYAGYLGVQRLALIDATHNVFLAPDDIDPLFLAAREPIVNNEFDGTSNTRSVYFSETWSPRTNLHLSLAARYNQTRVKNNLTARANADVGDLHEFRDFDTARPDSILCPSEDIADCPTELNNSSVADLRQIIDNPANLDERSRTRLVPTIERFRYQKLNPAFGVSYLPMPDLNFYAGWNQGTRAPSVVELGCAYDPTLIDVDSDLIPDVPAGIARPNACTLPTALSGDPFLPQVIARTVEFGLRGSAARGWTWNGAIYRTELEDDLYFVGGSRGQGSFQSIGNTLRRGFELGFSGQLASWLEFDLNYGYTEATFQTPLFIQSEHNSSRLFEGEGGGENQTYRPSNFDPLTGKALVQLEDMIEVRPDDRLPGVPLHNLNANLTVRPIDRLELGLGMVAHSGSFVRGNENNRHRTGVFDYRDLDTGPLDGNPVSEVYRFDGETPGFMVFNLRARLEISFGLSAFVQVNNLFDKEFFNAGRLGINPFAPAKEGAIGPSGWNYNSSEWTRTTFVAPGGPRAAWFGVELQL